MLKDLIINGQKVTSDSDFRDIYCLYFDEEDEINVLQPYDLSNVDEILSGLLEYQIPYRIFTRINGETVVLWESEK